MKISKSWLIIIVIVAILGFTNPSKENHIDSIVSLLSRKTFDDIIEEEDAYGALGATLGASLARNLAGNLVEVDNYILFSIAKAKRSGESRIISYGILGNVFFSSKAKEAFRD